MIRLEKHGKMVLFDDTGIDPTAPGSVRQYLFDGVFYEERFLDYIRSLGKKGVYVDAGALIGTHTLYFAILCGAEHVYAFEPRPGPRAELERNVKANAIGDRVTVSAMGLASEHKRVSVTLDRQLVHFDCAPLDELVNVPIDVLKMDVEGMELDVLRGARRILTTSKPVIFAEAHKEEEKAALAEFLRPFGYAPTGRVFNASPTYEFAPTGVPDLRAELESAYRDLARAERALAAYQQNRADELNALRSKVDLLRRRLASARGSLSFRIGRASKAALASARRSPLSAAKRWLDVFRGPDEVLEKALEDSELER